MGNMALKSCGTVGAIPSKIRVLLPDGQLVTFDGPVAVIDMMQQYPSHMVVHCSSDPMGMIGETPSMKIMLPDQQLSAGEAYIIYPVPPQYKTILLVAQSHWASKQTASETTFGVGHDDQDKIEAEEETKSCKMRSLRIVASLLPTRMAPCKPGETGQQNESLLKKSDEKAGDAHSQVDESEGANHGWKPALESIPESPLLEIPDSPLYFSNRPMEVL